MNLKQLLFTKNECYIANKKIAIKGIMVHSTGANNPNLRRYVGPDDGLLGKNLNNNHWNCARPGGRQVCVHAFIGKLSDGSIATYQTLPWAHRGWHGGSGSKGCVNDTHIGFEMCEDGLTDPAYFTAAYNEAVELCAYLCKEYNLNPLADGVLICHSEGYRRGIASNHGDVMHWFPKHGENMDTFRAAVKAAMGASGSPSNPSTPNTLYRVQCGAFAQKANADALAAKLKAAKYETYIVKVDNLYKVQMGAFSIKANADKLAAELKVKGFEAFVTTKAGTPA